MGALLDIEADVDGRPKVALHHIKARLIEMNSRASRQFSATPIPGPLCRSPASALAWQTSSAGQWSARFCYSANRHSGGRRIGPEYERTAPSPQLSGHSPTNFNC